MSLAVEPILIFAAVVQVELAILSSAETRAVPGQCLAGNDVDICARRSWRPCRGNTC